MTDKPANERQTPRGRYLWWTVAVMLLLIAAYGTTYLSGGYVGEYGEWPHGTRTVDGYIGARLRCFEPPLYWHAFIPLAWMEAKLTRHEVILGTGTGRSSIAGRDIAIQQAFQPFGESRVEGTRVKLKRGKMKVKKSPAAQQP